MGFNITQIINKFVPVKILGSDNNFFTNVTATTVQQVYSIPFDTREITVINDGSDSLNFFFGMATNTVFALTNPAWQFNGTWTDGNITGKPVKYTSNPSNSAVLKSNQLGVSSIILGILRGQGAGIFKIELSKDNGNTWVNPSSIAGVLRSDGVTGINLDTYDLYISTSSQDSIITYSLPPLNVQWAIRITPNGRNTNAVDSNVFLESSTMVIGGGYPHTLKVGESIGLNVKATQITVYSPTNTSGRVIAI